MEANKTIKAILQAPVWTFGISFTLGTILLLLHMIGQDEGLLVIGLLYVVAAFVVNLIVLLVLVALSFIHRAYQNVILQNAALILLNIPIAIVYIIIVFN
jgi:hypothetical protein